MALADLVHSGKKNDPHKIHIHGTIKDGKSTWASNSYAPLILDFEDGLSALNCESIPLFERTIIETGEHVVPTLNDLYHALSVVLEDTTGKNQTLVLDTCDWLERHLIYPAVCAERGVKSLEDIPYAKGYHFASEKWVTILAKLDQIRIAKNMMIILISHSKVERFEDPRAEAFDRYVPKLHKTSSAIINEWCHGVFFVTKKIITKKEDKGFNRTRVRGLDTGDSVMYCTGQPSHVAGNRLGLPAELPLDFAAYAEAAFGTPATEPVPEEVPPVKEKTTKKQKETING